MRKVICLCLGVLCALLLPLTALSSCGSGTNQKVDSDSTGTQNTAEENTGEETAASEEETVDSAPAEDTDAVSDEPAESETDPAVTEEDQGLSRDGTPKKYFTLSFDDGITQDAQLMEILKKYNMSCCTFFINTGLTGVSWEWVGLQYDRPDVTHVRFTRDDLISGVYDGFDVAVHTSSHRSLKGLNDAQVKQEVAADARMITRFIGTTPVGMAWPGGDTEYTEQTILAVLDKTDIRFARGTTSTFTFALPEYFMTWYPTCSIVDDNVLELAEQFIQAECTEDMLFYVWGHGYELDVYDIWDRVETLVRMISEAAEQDDTIVLVTNTQFYQLFKDEIPSWKSE